MPSATISAPPWNHHIPLSSILTELQAGFDYDRVSQHVQPFAKRKSLLKAALSAYLAA